MERPAGKSHEALKDYTNDSHYLYPNDNGWWDRDWETKESCRESGR